MRLHFLFLTIILCFGILPESIAGQSYLKISITNVSCQEKMDGKIQVEIDKNLPSGYQLIISDSLKQIFHVFDSTYQGVILLENLPAKKYTLLLIAGDIKEEQGITIESPEKLQLEVIKIISTEGSGQSIKATLQAFPSGGTLPYSYQWSENTGNQQTMTTSNLPLGIYNCKVNDKNNCGFVEATFYLFEDEIEKFNKELNTK